MKALMRTRNEFGILVLRLGLAAVILPNGILKVFEMDLLGKTGRSLDATVEHFKTLQITFGESVFQVTDWMAYGVVAAELLGGAALVLGFLTRLSALGIVAVMAGAINIHHSASYWPPQGYMWHILAIAAGVCLLFKGGGALSVDRMLSSDDTIVLQ